MVSDLVTHFPLILILKKTCERAPKFYKKVGRPDISERRDSLKWYTTVKQVNNYNPLNWKCTPLSYSFGETGC